MEGRSTPAAKGILGGRFVLGELARRGGMSAVYRATDTQTSAPVAIKIAERSAPADTERFHQEARILEELVHPAVVRYVASGMTAEGDVYHAMEWLDGLDLATLLARRRLDAAETIAVLKRACEALSTAHDRGVVHRDVKPSNLFLVDGDPSRLKVIDFGIARLRARAHRVTGSGVLLGTVGYMAPEQLRGGADVDGRADVFALGCVAFECLTGRRAFASEHDVAALVKVLMDEPPRVRQLSPDVPPALDALVAHMLAKDPDARPQTMVDVLGALAELASTPPGAHLEGEPSAPRPLSQRPREVLTDREQRFVSVMLVARRTDSLAPGDTLLAADASTSLAPLRAVVERYGGQLTVMADGILVATHAGRGGARDQAARAAACALAMRSLDGVRCASLATGLAESTARSLVGPVADRAAELLRRGWQRDREDDRGRTTPRVLVDGITASLIEARFVVRADGDALELQSERAAADVQRTLLGKPTPCVGRDAELAFLEALCADSFSQPAARAVLVTGPAGIGKSGLRSELVARVRARGDVRVLLARADQVGAGSSLALVRQLVRAGTSAREGAPPDEQRRDVLAHLSRSFAGDDLRRTADFLLEVLGLPPGPDPSPTMRAARNDARIMNEWMRRSFEDWIQSECGARPLLLVVDDLHWGDLPSMHFVEKAFARLRERPVTLVALARPEVHDAFPRLRTSTRMQEIALQGLARRSSEQLARHALGEDAAHETIARVVHQADGNAFYLEELIRCVAHADHASLPETVLGMVQARLDGIDPEARRLLRVASIFGEVFRPDAVHALVGGSARPSDVAAHLDGLVERELLVTDLDDRHDGRDPREGQHPGPHDPHNPHAPNTPLTRTTRYAFRHALLREAAYALLTAEDRATGHSLAAEWLEAAGETDALVIADHFDKGGRVERAIPWLVRAAEVAIHAGDNARAVSIAERGLGEAPAELRGTLLSVEQLALSFQGKWAEAIDVASRAMASLPPGSSAWYRAAGSRMLAGIYLGRSLEAADVVEHAGTVAALAPTGPFGLAMYMLVAACCFAGARDLALLFQRRLEDASRAQTDADPAFTAWLDTARATTRLNLDEDIAGTLAAARDALAGFEHIADTVGQSVAKMLVGLAQSEAGDVTGGAAILREVAASRPAPSADFARYYLARIEALNGSIAGAEALLGATPRVADGARSFLAEVHLRHERYDEARAVAETIQASPSVFARATASSILGRVALHRDDAADALRRTDAALRIQDEGSASPYWRSVLLLTRVDALRALGRETDADAALADAEARLTRAASRMEDPALAERYLTSVEPNARTMALAAARFGPPAERGAISGSPGARAR